MMNLTYASLIAMTASVTAISVAVLRINGYIRWSWVAVIIIIVMCGLAYIGALW